MMTILLPAIGFPGGMEMFWIFLIVLVLFGASALPKLFRSLGRSVREFKKAQDGLYDEMEKADKADQADSGRKGDQKADTSAGDTKPSKGPSSTTDA
jgi:sec-independent protein translocase protein TatA